MQEKSQRAEVVQNYVNKEFDSNEKHALIKFVQIPNLSRAFDPEWESNGLLLKAAHFLKQWVEKQEVTGLKSELITEPGHTPLLLFTIPGSSEQTDQKQVLMYGHLDKQPHGIGWNQGYGPVDAKEKDGKLWGRGTADDGYAIFAAILSIKACINRKAEHPRVVIIIEADEESAGMDLPYYLKKYKEKFGTPSLIVCLDSGGYDFQRLWLTNTLRGVQIFNLTVKILEEGLHSGEWGGIFPDSFRIIRLLLNRLENPETGEMPSFFYAQIPEYFKTQLKELSQIMGDLSNFEGKVGSLKSLANPDLENANYQLLLNKLWKPNLAITGVDGIPSPKDGGNVLRSFTTVKCSIRIPPSLKCADIRSKVVQLLTTDVPYGAQVTVDEFDEGDGFVSPQVPQNLHKIFTDAGRDVFGNEPTWYGCGGSIPFMADLGEIYPQAQFLVTGVGHPTTNAHGPNQNLDLSFCKKLISTISLILEDYTSLK